jgi:hypothetical protein
VFHLLGLVHGHWKIDPTELNDPQVAHVDEGINVGLAIVVHSAAEALTSPKAIISGVLLRVYA